MIWLKKVYSYLHDLLYAGCEKKEDVEDAEDS